MDNMPCHRAAWNRTTDPLIIRHEHDLIHHRAPTVCFHLMNNMTD